jgi:aryl hydrocarbon receptor nuclear translocator-like protein 1
MINSMVMVPGYLKSWASAEMCESGSSNGGGEGPEDGDAVNLSCLVAVGRALPGLALPPPPTRRLQYVSRHATDGKFLFVDQRFVHIHAFLYHTMNTRTLSRTQVTRMRAI